MYDTEDFDHAIRVQARLRGFYEEKINKINTIIYALDLARTARATQVPATSETAVLPPSEAVLDPIQRGTLGE